MKILFFISVLFIATYYIFGQKESPSHYICSKNNPEGCQTMFFNSCDIASKTTSDLIKNKTGQDALYGKPSGEQDNYCSYGNLIVNFLKNLHNIEDKKLVPALINKACLDGMYFHIKINQEELLSKYKVKLSLSKEEVLNAKNICVENSLNLYENNTSYFKLKIKQLKDVIPKFMLFLIIFGYLYLMFLPSSIAAKRNHPHHTLILIISIFVSPTIIGWIVCLIWALSYKDKQSN